MSLPKFRRFYFPGLISLIFLPVMCSSYLIENNTFYKPRGMKVAWCDNKLFAEFHIASFRKYDTLRITGNSTHDAVKISELNKRLKMLIVQNDVKNGLIVVFGDKSNYAEFINVLDLCFLSYDKGLVFAPFHNKLFIGHVALQHQPMPNPRFLVNDVIYHTPVKPVPDFFSIDNLKNISSKILALSKTYWAPELLFALMLFFVINKKRRFLDLGSFKLITG